jgi:large subunit ribosomal protein L31
MPKKDIHPNWFKKAHVYCDGKLITTTSSTKHDLYVDVWSGNHPFF